MASISNPNVVLPNVVSNEEKVVTQQEKITKKDPSIFSHDYWMQKHNIKTADVPRTFLYFKTISYVSWFATWALCYRLRPFKTLSKYDFVINKMNSLRAKYPNAVTKYTNFVSEKTLKLSNNKYFSKIPLSVGLKSKRFTESFVENIVINKFALPITFPTYIYVAATLTKNHKIKDLTN
jgi:hypothetical protein